MDNGANVNLIQVFVIKIFVTNTHFILTCKIIFIRLNHIHIFIKISTKFFVITRSIVLTFLVTGYTLLLSFIQFQFNNLLIS